MAITTRVSAAYNDNIAKNGCYRCLKDCSDHWGPLLDFEAFIEVEGWLVICSACIHEAATLLGWMKPEDCATLQSELEEARKELNYQRMLAAKKDKALTALADVVKKDKHVLA